MALLDGHKDRFGVEPICRVLTAHGVKIAPSTYYAHRDRPPSARAVRAAAVLAVIRRLHADDDVGRGVYGVRKIHAELRRQGGVAGRPVSYRQVTRLMRQAGLRGVQGREKSVTTTTPDASAPRPPDLVERDFTAPAPNRLWLVDFTVPTWSGMKFTAFVSDAFSRRVVGWRTASSMPTSLPLDALEMALWTRDREGRTDSDGRLPGLIHHSDARSVHRDPLQQPADRGRRRGQHRNRRRQLRQQPGRVVDQPVQAGVRPPRRAVPHRR